MQTICIRSCLQNTRLHSFGADHVALHRLISTRAAIGKGLRSDQFGRESSFTNRSTDRGSRAPRDSPRFAASDRPSARPAYARSDNLAPRDEARRESRAPVDRGFNERGRREQGARSSRFDAVEGGRPPRPSRFDAAESGRSPRASRFDAREKPSRYQDASASRTQPSFDTRSRSDENGRHISSRFDDSNDKKRFQPSSREGAAGRDRGPTRYGDRDTENRPPTFEHRNSVRSSFGSVNRDERSSVARGAWTDAVRDTKPAEELYSDDAQFARNDALDYREAYTKAPRRSNASSADEVDDDGLPISVPYTTAASRFLYGYNVVVAALKAQRRKLYRLHISQVSLLQESDDQASASHRNDHRSESKREALENLKRLAKAAGVSVNDQADRRFLDKVSDRRPHNGVVLEASTVPLPPVLSLGKYDASLSRAPLHLEEQSKELADVNGTPEEIRLVRNIWRQPFVVFLDGITDPGNIGNIIRTCHFFGVDAVAMATNTCANPSSPVLAKASSGAYEAMPIYQIPKPSAFLYESAANGWKVYAAMAPGSDAASRGKKETTSSQIAASSPLISSPCILVLGAEGEGLRQSLQNRAEFFVSIQGGAKREDKPDVGVDSVNVSVAAGILAEAFVREPAETTERLF